MADEKIPDDILWHQSGVNRGGEPFVQLLRGQQLIAQMSPGQAREHAMAILEAAEAAETDAFIMTYMKGRIGLDEDRAARMLIDFREYRGQLTGKRGGPTNKRDWVMPDATGGTEDDNG